MKFYKNWPFWFRGGIFLVLVIFVLTIVLLPCRFYTGFGTQPEQCSAVFAVPGGIVLVLLSIVLPGFDINLDTFFPGLILVWLFSAILYFLFGAIWGLIYSKIHNKV